MTPCPAPSALPWPTFKNGWPLSLDLVLLTATKPTINTSGAYPTAEAVAKAWIECEDQGYYFRNNLLAGIKTSDDEAISALLDT